MTAARNSTAGTAQSRKTSPDLGSGAQVGRKLGAATAGGIRPPKYTMR